MLKRFAVVAFALALMVGGVWAQRTTGSISGTVLDPQGAAIPGAKITILNSSTGAKIELTADENGSFVVPDLPPSAYKVSITGTGFKTFETVATVRVGVVSQLEAKMELGATSSVVTVESSAIAADVTKATVQGTVEASRIESLPLNGRNFLDLAQQEPGVQIVDGGTFDPTKNQFAGVSIGGRSGRVTRIQVDGVDITDETVGTTVANISNESIQEFGIQQSSLDISTDVTSSGAVNIITRSGGNQFHGSGFGFFRNSAWASDLRLNKTSPTVDEPPFDRQQIGGRASGPFIKDRLFWAVDYEYNNQDGQQFTNVPEFSTNTGAFGVPLDERLASGRLDWSATNTLRGFYRMQHNYNNAVTGFGARDLSAFSNLNNTNVHVFGVDYSRGRWTHGGRFSYLNFNNFIVDGNAAAGTPTTAHPDGTTPMRLVINTFLTIGPDSLAPQSTFQDNKQSKYDASYVWGKHTWSFGMEHNRIEQFVYANFFGLSPQVRASNNATTRAIAATNPFGPGGITNPLNFPLDQIRVGNGLGYFSEKPALGYPYGGTVNHRLAFYAHDSWKVTPNLTFNYGVRYTWHSNLSNSDLDRVPLIGLFDPTLTGRPHRDGNNFGPQAGFAWNVFGDGKTVIRAGAGIYYETNIFNSILFDRVINLPAGIGNERPAISSASPRVINPANGATLFDFTTNCTGLPGNNCFGAPLGAVMGFATQAQGLFQAAAAALAAGFPQPGVPPLFNASLNGTDLIDPRYKSPYGAQMNFGVQRELRPGLVLSVDYTRNRGVHFNQIRDRNRLGAADSLNVTRAQTVVTNTLTACGAATVAAALVSCPSFAGGRAVLLTDFTSRGLGSGSGVDGQSFDGVNPNFRAMGIIEPIGLSLFQALQFRMTGKMGSWGWFRNINTNLTYSLSRFEATGADQDFIPASAFNDRPTEFFGPAGLDRTSQVGLTFTWDMPGNFRISTTNAMRSALASSLFMPTRTGGNAEIYFSDLDGDGVTQDPIGGTLRGAFSRGVKASDIANLIATHNSTVAGTLSPAAMALAQAGLFTQAQLTQLGAVINTVVAPPADQVNNDSFFTTDVRFSWRYKPTESITIEPMFEVFNLFNISNFTGLSNTLNGGAGDANGTTRLNRPARVGLGSGSFSSGIPRAAQFGFRVSF